MLIRARCQLAKASRAIDERAKKASGFEISDECRWAQVAILQKIRDGLPSTTNALERITGHLNRSVGRNHCF
jgi:hypothetical protein